MRFKDCKTLLTNCIYLEDSAIEIKGVKFYGTPHQPPYNDWGFNRDEKEREALFSKIPQDADVVICHGPIYDVLDLCKDGTKAGCKILKRIVLEEVKPRLFVCGHIHESYGVVDFNFGKIVNASICTYKYNPYNKPVVVDIPLLNYSI